MTDLIAKAKQLCEEATPGPWSVMGPWPTVTIYVEDRALIDDSIQPTQIAEMSIECDAHGGQLSCADHPDAAFIAASRELIPALIDSHRNLEARHDAAREELELERNNALSWRSRAATFQSAFDAASVERDAAVAKARGHELARDIAIKRGNDFGDALLIATNERDAAIARAESAEHERDLLRALNTAAVERAEKAEKERDEAQRRAAYESELTRSAQRQLAACQAELVAFKSAAVEHLHLDMQDIVNGTNSRAAIVHDTAEAIAALADENAQVYDNEAPSFTIDQDYARWRGKAQALRTFAADIRANAWRKDVPR